MQIITIDDASFPKLLDARKQGKEIGRYARDGRVQLVSATDRFVMVTQAHDPQKIAIKPARNIGDAEYMALEILRRERSRGSEVEIVTEAAGR